MNTEVKSQDNEAVIETAEVFNTKAAADSTLPAIFIERPRDIIIALIIIAQM